MKKTETAVMKLSELTPARYNPREISEAAMAGLENSVERFGLVQPIIWNKTSGNVVGGHQRLKVLEKMNVKKTTVIVVELDDIEEKALNITLNNPTIAGEFTDDLQDIINEIKTDDPVQFDDLRLDMLDNFDGLFDPPPSEPKEPGTGGGISAEHLQALKVVQSLVSFIDELQQDCSEYLNPTSEEKDNDWLVGRMVESLDGPRQRELFALADGVVEKV